MFEEEDSLYEEELLGEDGLDDDDYDDDFDDDDEGEYEGEYDDESGIDFLGMVQDDEGNWVYPEDLD